MRSGVAVGVVGRDGWAPEFEKEGSTDSMSMGSTMRSMWQSKWRYAEAERIFGRQCTAPELGDFLTLDAYNLIVVHHPGAGGVSPCKLRVQACFVGIAVALLL